MEDKRQELVMSVQKVQANLYAMGNGPTGGLDRVAQNVSSLDEQAGQCSSCHHEDPVAKKLETMQLLIRKYQEAFSKYITASGDATRIQGLKLEAARLGNGILLIAEGMSHRSGDKLMQVMAKVGRRERSSM